MSKTNMSECPGLTVAGDGIEVRQHEAERDDQHRLRRISEFNAAAPHMDGGEQALHFEKAGDPPAF